MSHAPTFRKRDVTKAVDELLLICTPGSCTPDPGRLIDSVQSTERSDRHSEKPERFYEAMYDHGRKLELFARSGRSSWGSIGNEIALAEAA
jgi:N6-adenosine-specific RNA methylase IME4